MKVWVYFVLALVAAASAKVYLKETFDGDWESRWVQSSAKEDFGHFTSAVGKHYGDKKINTGIKTSEDAKFYGMTASFEEFSNKGKDLVLSFTVKNDQKIDCGGGYIKLLPAGFDADKFDGETVYNVMFGPDICGPSNKKTHLIFRHGEENLLSKKEIKVETDEITHVYTFIVKPDSTYVVEIDENEVATGSLYENWDFLLAREIPDPAVTRPSDWDDREKIDDPEDVKPADWPVEFVEDPEAEIPEDWSDELDGEWEAPMVPNPEYSPWTPKQIVNPAYQGKWEHPMIANPDFVEHEDVYMYESFAGVGFDLWQVKSGTVFDNIIVADDKSEVDAFIKETWGATFAAEKKMYDTEQEEIKKKQAEEAAAREAAAAAAAEEEDDDEEFEFDDEDDL